MPPGQLPHGNGAQLPCTCAAMLTALVLPMSVAPFQQFPSLSLLP
ncbi:hypothetical protein SLNWT_7070 [Streptomyces albus]|uniref:Uncharacterized protein n=1 Tax=Streptomyces albus (strain ATCC 21838 / DSM 41398 / FERM P-419 / JCM 4703 / NBRC 107858) TaxID=1081613 RepID=A0A0B5F9D3_STRA4|nr:hypothetical protein SLNWT_7070 [Streptomyces albus]AOU81749.1 hypothetical protein SLNHY_7058 [Streptomyces albus]